MRSAKLTARRRQHLTSHDLTRELHAVAQAKDRHAEIKEFRIALRCPRLIHAHRSAGEDESLRPQLRYARRRNIVADDLREYVLLAHSPGDELGVLGAEVEDQDAFSLGKRRHDVP